MMTLSTVSGVIGVGPPSGAAELVAQLVVILERHVHLDAILHDLVVLQSNVHPRHFGYAEVLEALPDI
jgi:hypothetical protein